MEQTTGADDLRRNAESTVATIAEQAQQTAEAHVSTQKDQAANALHSVAEAVRQSSGQLRREQPQLASLATQAAERVDRASEYIRGHDVRDFVREAEQFARREPLIFLGGAFAVGFLAARFLKASSPEQGGAAAGATGSYDSSRAARLPSGRWEDSGQAVGSDATGYGAAGAYAGAGTTGGTDYSDGTSDSGRSLGGDYGAADPLATDDDLGGDSETDRDRVSSSSYRADGG